MTDKNKYTVSRAQRILEAIENENYKARTIVGISEETKVPIIDIKNLLVSSALLKDKVMELPGIKKNNHSLYVTTEKYKKETPLAVRVLNLLKSR